jgi:DNA-binding beta-propeller fold protein YncE
LYVANYLNSTVGDFSASTGSAIAGFTSPAEITGPSGLAVSNGDLYVENFGSDGDEANGIGEFTAATGAVMDATLIGGLDGPTGLALLGGDLFVVNEAGNSVGEYDDTSGNPVDGFVSPSGLNEPEGITVAPVPEPGIWGLLAVAALVSVAARRRPRMGRELV